MKYIEIKVTSAKMVYDVVTDGKTSKTDGKKTSKTELHHFDITRYNIPYDKQLSTETDEKMLYNPNIPIVFTPISNMLHVLLGVRPAPRNRKSLHKRVEYIDNIARNGFMKIENIFYYIKDNKTKPVYEICKGQKCKFNSHSGNTYYTNIGENENVKGYITWMYLKKRFLFNSNIDNYNKLRNKILELNDWNDKLSLGVACRNIYKNKDKYNDFLSFLNDNEKNIKFFKTFINLCEGKDVFSFNQVAGNPCLLTVNSYPQRKVTFNCTFIFPMEDKDIEEIMKNKQVATYLDGGVAEFVKVLDRCNRNLLLDNDFIEINNIPE